LPTSSYRCGAFSIDPDNRRFSHEDVELALEPKVLAVIIQLLNRAGTLVTRNELLDAVWGHRYVTPSTLSRVIALARRAFGDDSDDPQFIQTVHGAGYRYIGPVERTSELSVDFAPPPRMRIPARVESLIGRERELAQLANMLTQHRAVTVLGTGGMGKTQCALELARRIAPDYRDGVWFFDLAPLPNAGEWLRALAAALSIRRADGSETLTEIGHLLTGRRMLLVLDNCDRMAAETGELILGLLRSTDLLRVLSTSQQSLGFLGEQHFRMPPLDLPDAGATDRASVERAAACALLLLRVSAVQPGFALTDANQSAIIEICRQLDGMPLALELAAARFAVLSPEQVLARLTQRFRFLASDLAGRERRHRNLLALLDWSYNLLAPAEQRLLAWLSIFVRGWAVDAATAIAAEQGHDAATAVDLLSGLVNKSLVTLDPGYAPPRYRLLESVREFALERLHASGEEPQAREAHLAYVGRLCASSHEQILEGRMSETVERLMQEHGNIASALEHARVAAPRREAALGIVGALTLYLKGHGSYGEGVKWCELALRDSEPHDSAVAGRALLCKGVQLFHTIATRSAVEPILLAATELARKHGDRWTEGYSAGYHALCLALSGDTDAATVLAETTNRIAIELRQPVLQGLTGLARGWIHLARGEPARAVEAMSAVQDLGGDLHQQHFIELYIALALFDLGEWRSAARQMHEGLRHSATVRNLRGMAGSIEGCAYIAAGVGRCEEAARLFGAAMQLRERTGVPLFRFWIAHHEHALETLRAALGPVACDEHLVAGRALREEDSIKMADTLLREFAGASSEIAS
jgi:non-specific serine/threonine protein kinase